MDLKKNLPILLVAGFLLLGGLLLSVAKPSRYSEVSFVTSGSSRPMGAWVPPDQRELAPAFDFLDLDEREHSLDEFRGGTPLLLVFWKTDCPACLLELPQLEELVSRWKGRGIKILALSEDLSLRTLERYAKTNKRSYSIGWDRGGEAAFSYGVKGVPFVVVLDSRGRKAYEDFELPASLENVFEGASES